jgi:membrane fusion protein (multidrug efflux system)
VVANFKETQVHDLHVGDPAKVRIDAYPGTLWRGHVASFSPATGSQYALLPQEPASGNFTRVVQRVPVRIALDAAEGGERAAGPGFPVALPVGLSAEVTVVPP